MRSFGVFAIISIPVSRHAFAFVATGQISASRVGGASVLGLAFVDVFACALISFEEVARVTAAGVRSDGILAALLTLVRFTETFVDV